MKRIIAMVNNVSAEPYRLVSPMGNAEVKDLPPSLVWRYAKTGRADLALLPVAKVNEVIEIMEPLGDYGVACDGPVGSVLLISKLPIADLVLTPSVYVHRESETSRRLLQYLWRHEFGHDLTLLQNAENAMGTLWIGDKALQRKNQAPDGVTVMDLSEWWGRLTGLSFVFARWAVRRSSSEEFKRAARQWLSDSVTCAASDAGRDRMSQRAMKAGLFAQSSAAKAYFAALISAFSEKELRGEEVFLDFLGRDDVERPNNII